MSTPFVLMPGRLGLGDLRALRETSHQLVLDEGAREGVARAREVVARAVDRGERVYGLTTGVGSLSDTAISKEDLSELQRRFLLSNAAGTGPLLDDRQVALVTVLKINTLGLAYSGVREALIDALIALYNARAWPCIPAKGSVGASGDLAPLAHLGAALIGVGEVRLGGERLPAAEALERIGLPPLELAPKEGIAIVNGTQVSTALALHGLFALEDAFAAALVAGALSLEAALGSAGPFDERVQVIRGQRGQAEVAAAYRTLLAASEFREAPRDRVQDPYSLRCQPQVLGACLDLVRFAADTLAREANGCSDNPLVFAGTGEILYGGNFHAAPVGLAADVLALAIAEIGSMSERRTALLVDEHMSGLPAFLVASGGLNSGFMVAQVTAAALASENKAMAHPGSIDSLPTSANQEDYVSMATYAARRLGEMADNLAGILAIELLAACQGVHLRRPRRTSETLEHAIAALRERVPVLEDDRFMAPDIEAAKALIQSGWFRELVPAALLPSASA